MLSIRKIRSAFFVLTLLIPLLECPSARSEENWHYITGNVLESEKQGTLAQFLEYNRGSIKNIKIPGTLEEGIYVATRNLLFKKSGINIIRTNYSDFIVICRANHWKATEKVYSFYDKAIVTTYLPPYLSDYLCLLNRSGLLMK